MAIGRRIWTVTQTITRPANATQYTATDAVSTTAGAVLTFAGVASHVKMGGRITGLCVHKTKQDETAADFDLALFDTTFTAGSIADNAAIALTDAEWQTCVGFVAMEAADWRNVVTGSVWHKTNLDWPFQCAANSTSLFGCVIARGAYTPASGEVFTIRLSGEAY